MPLGRTYTLTIQTNTAGQAVTITLPFTVSFRISRSTMGSLNSAQFEIYNLSESTRSQIFQDRFNPRVYKSVIFQAGYGSKQSVIFKGNLYQANSRRLDTGNIVTFLDCRDGGFDTVNSLTNKTIIPPAQGLSMQSVVQNLTGDFQYLKTGNLSGITGTVKRPLVLTGNTFDLINKYVPGLVYVDLEELHALKPNQVLTGYIPLINSATGLLGTPKRDDSYISIRSMFQPGIIMGQLLEVESSIQREYNGQYKVIGLRHHGIISGAVSGALESEFDLLVGSQLFGGFNKV